MLECRPIMDEDLLPSTRELLSRPSREPCTYCKKNHLDYACDAQLEYIKENILNKGHETNNHHAMRSNTRIIISVF